MTLEKGKSKKTVEKNTKKLISEGYKPAQAYAIAKDAAKPKTKPKKK